MTLIILTVVAIIVATEIIRLKQRIKELEIMLDAQSKAYMNVVTEKIED